MRCGSCKSENVTIDHVKSCFGVGSVLTKAPELGGFAKKYVDSRDFQPMATAPEPLPDSCYALQDEKGLVFYEVNTGKKGTKWEGFQFLSRLIGHPGTWLKTPVKGANKAAVMNLLRQDPLEAARLFSKTFTVCAACGSPLSDPESIERAMGPVCIARFQ